ncbi:MAG: hypothetical protein K2J40_02815 [Ruminococcus sp.]|nr:hypothetical protein [Ruminococcus sp.]
MKRKLISIAAICAVMLSAVISPLSFSGKTVTQTAYAAGYDSEQLQDYAYQVAAIVNRERAANGLKLLKYSDTLSDAAIVRANEIQTYFSHTRPNGTSCFTAVTDMGIRYRYIGENIAYGQKSPEDVMNAWMNSSGHRANILSENFDYIGIGVTYRNGTYYWTQFFAASDDLTGDVITSDTIPAETTTTTTTATTKTTTTTTMSEPVITEVTTTTATSNPAETVTTTIITENKDLNNIQSEIIKMICEKLGINPDDLNIISNIAC